MTSLFKQLSPVRILKQLSGELISEEVRNIIVKASRCS
jgi:hypothetical protein